MSAKSPSFIVGFAIAVLSGLSIACVVGVTLLASVPEVSAEISARSPAIEIAR